MEGTGRIQDIPIRPPEGFDVSWAGALAPRSPFPICIGSVDGRLRFLRDDFTIDARETMVSRDAINGVAVLGNCIAVSTRNDIGFFSANQGLVSWPFGAHGVIAADSYFLAPFGEGGLLTFNPFDSPTTLLSHSAGPRDTYVYRVAAFRDKAIACAARSAGIVSGVFSPEDTKSTLRTMTFPGMDIVDLCPLSPESRGFVALGRDGSLLLSKDILSSDKPTRMKFASIRGAAYRVLCYLGDIYVLTSTGLFVLANLGQETLTGDWKETTKIWPSEMRAIDMNIACGCLLLVRENDVWGWNANEIHNAAPKNDEAGVIPKIIAMPDTTVSQTRSVTKKIAA